MSNFGDKDIFLEIPAGNITGQSSVHKFGRNEAVGTTQEDVWDGGGTYGFYPTAAVACDVDSTSASDASMSVRIFGLDGTGALQEEVVTLDAADPSATPVATANSYWRIFRMINESSADNVGAITLRNNGAAGGLGDNTIGAQITIGFNQTLMAIYTIPVGKTGYMVNWDASTDRNAGATAAVDLELRVRPASSVSARQVFQIKNHHGLVLAGTTFFDKVFTPYQKINALSDIVVRATASSSTADVHADFDLILVDD